MPGDLHLAERLLEASLKQQLQPCGQGPKHSCPRLRLPMGMMKGLLASKIMKLMNQETVPCGLENITSLALGQTIILRCSEGEGGRD